MINNIISNTLFVSSNTPFCNVNSNPFCGMIRLNGSDYEFFDGVTWNKMYTTATVDLSFQTQQAIDWAIRKMNEEKKLDEYCKQYPALDEARNNFELIKKLVVSNERTT